MNFLIKLSETDKRVILVVLLLVILLLIIAWCLGYITVRISKYQGKKIDTAVSDVVQTRVITDPKHFKKYAHKKNWQMFYKSAKIPALIILAGGLVLLIRNCIFGFNYNPFNNLNGFGTVLFTWDFSKAEYVNVFFLPFQVLKEWPPLSNTPHFVGEAWAAYIFVTCLFVGGIWYLCCVASLISRFLRIKKLSKQIFEKRLDNFNQHEQFMNQVNNQTNPNTNEPNDYFKQ